MDKNKNPQSHRVFELKGSDQFAGAIHTRLYYEEVL